LNSALDGGEWSASRSGRFIAREKAPLNGWAPKPVWKCKIWGKTKFLWQYLALVKSG